MRVSKLITAALALCLLAGSAQAAFTAFWQQENPTAAAIAGDANLANMQSWSLYVTTDGDWLSAGLNATLPGAPANAFYRVPGAPPVTWNAFGSAAQLFSTSVTAPEDAFGDRSPTVLGGYPTGSASNGTSASTSPGVFSVSWGDLVTTAAGTHFIGRLTFPSSINPLQVVVSGDSRTSANPGNATIQIPQLVIPEPASLALIAFVGLAGLRRRSA